jgi:carbonic anhydrase
VVHASDYEKKGEDPFTEPDQKGEPPPEEKTPEEDGHHKNDDHSSSGQSSADVGAYWAYEGEYGPTDWHKISPDFATCHAGKFQSPVALSPTRAEGGLEELDFGYQPTEVAFRHGGYTLEASLKEAGYLRFRGHRYNLVNVHFHNPSEHSVDGMKSDMEIHLFHKDQSGNQAMLAIMVMTGDRDFGPIDPIFRHLPEVKGETGPSHSLNPRALLPRSHLYYTYRGSQTTPPCSEGVQWFVLSEPIYFSARQLDQYLAIFPRNARPLQAAADREIRTGGSEIRQVSH